MCVFDYAYSKVSNNLQHLLHIMCSLIGANYCHVATDIGQRTSLVKTSSNLPVRRIMFAFLLLGLFAKGTYHQIDLCI